MKQTTIFGSTSSPKRPFGPGDALALLLVLALLYIGARLALNAPDVVTGPTIDMIPLLDVLQSVPIISFQPVVLLGFSAILPEVLAVDRS